jgi:glycosyltransferase involved in cell wall biosynthesis
MIPEQTHKLVFLGGLLLESQSGLIEKNTRVNVQHAADALQRAILRGFAERENALTVVVNVPYIASYPRGDRAIWFPAIADRLFGFMPVRGMGFFNLLVARVISRFWAASRGLDLETRRQNSGTIFVYAAHLPFVLAALTARRRNPAVRLCLILPDLPEFMGEGGPIYKTLVAINKRIFYRLAPKFDYFAVLTEPMAERLGIGADRYVVMEGIYDPGDETAVPAWPTDPGPTFIYTGTLAARYGILDLLSAFSTLDMPNAKLWICGDGDARAAVEDMARRDARVTFFGRVPRAEALTLQAQAHVMVNPRRPEGEFTRFSFPSKTMEYLASARPVIMHWLDGMPPEYRPYLMTPATGDAEGLAAEMRRVAALPPETLQQIGAEGRHFVLTQKNPKVQVGRLLDMVMPTVPEHPTDQKPR